MPWQLCIHKALQARDVGDEVETKELDLTKEVLDGLLTHRTKMDSDGLSFQKSIFFMPLK